MPMNDRGHSAASALGVPNEQPATPISRGAQTRYPQPKEFLTVKEASGFLNVSKSFLDKLRCHGGGPIFTRLGARKVLYRRADLEAWARQRRFESTAQYHETGR